MVSDNAQAVFDGKAEGAIIQGDCLEVMKGWPDGCVDLVFGSPPYEDRRTYGIGFALRGQAWVDWMVDVVRTSLRTCRGLVAFVVEGKTEQYRYSCAPLLLIADLHRAGVHLRKPPVFHRVGIAGSGGPDWLRNDYEFIICATNGGRLPWSDNTAMGHPPKWAPGGAMSHRTSSGARVNQWGHPLASGGTGGTKDDITSCAARPSHHLAREHTKRRGDGTMEKQSYIAPAMANPGNVVSVKVGGGVMGHRLCHENEAPFPEDLARFFIRSFCPPGGVVVDTFSGSGTTASVCRQEGRRFIVMDVRGSQEALTHRRLAATPKPLPGLEAKNGR